MFDRKNIIIKSASISSILILWWLINEFGIINPLFVPNIKDTFLSLFESLGEASTYYSLFLTVFRAYGGLLLAAIIGIPIGLLLTRLTRFFKFVEFPFEFFRSIPPSALFPLFILFFGIGDLSKIAVSFYACSFILIINSFYGALPNQEKTERINMLRTFGASNFQIFYMAIIKDALPNITAGIRVCLSYSLALVVVTEMFLAANQGLGKDIYDYYLQYNIPEMYSHIIILGIVGFTINQIYRYFENRFIFWGHK